MLSAQATARGTGVGAWRTPPERGGRQVDGAIASLDALPGIVGAVGREIPILLDSGIRGGADAFKALAWARAQC